MSCARSAMFPPCRSIEFDSGPACPVPVSGARAGRGPLLPLLLQAAPGGLVLVEDGKVGHLATGGVDMPAPEESPLQVGAVGLEQAEDEAVHAVQDAELEDVGADETP